MKHRLLMAVLAIAIVVAMTGWVYALARVPQLSSKRIKFVGRTLFQNEPWRGIIGALQ
jgi:hypothetical protein